MELSEPEVIMDLGGGSGSLSIEASKVWLKSKFVSVDIDDKTSSCHRAPNVFHFVKDVLDQDLHKKIEQPLQSADAAICNPPYIKSLWREEFSHILSEAGLDSLVPTMGEMSADVLFIAQNLRFLKSGGKLGLILPDSIITGEKSFGLRKALMKQHTVEKVIELPRGVFKNTDAKAHIVVITKGGAGTSKIQLNKLSKNSLLSKPIYICSNEASKRMDYSYFCNRTEIQSLKKLSFESIGASLVRGNINSAQVRNSKLNIFHSTDFLKEGTRGWPHVPSAFRLSKSETKNTKTKIAKKGDILICRVGRNLHTKIAYVPSGFVAISDCVYRLRLPEHIRKGMFSFLRSGSGESVIKSLCHGVGAKHLSRRDILELVLIGMEFQRQND